MATKKTGGATPKPAPKKKPAAAAGGSRKKPAAAEPAAGDASAPKAAAKRKSTAKKPASKKAPAKKPAAKKSAAKKAAAKASPAKKAPAAKKPASGVVDRSKPLEVQASKKKKPASAAVRAAPAPAAEPVVVAPPRRKSSKFNPTAVVKPVKKKKPVERKKYKVPVGRRAASHQDGDAPAAPVAEPQVAPEGGFTPEQLRKVKTGIGKKKLAAFRENLLQHRRELLGDVANIDAARGTDDGDSHVPLHMADVGSENYEKEFNLMLQETERKLLLDIDEALLRLRDGTFGVCLDTAVPIGEARLEIKPWARYSIAAMTRRENAGLGGR